MHVGSGAKNMNAFGLFGHPKRQEGSATPHAVLHSISRPQHHPEPPPPNS